MRLDDLDDLDTLEAEALTLNEQALALEMRRMTVQREIERHRGGLLGRMQKAKRENPTVRTFAEIGALLDAQPEEEALTVKGER